MQLGTEVKTFHLMCEACGERRRDTCYIIIGYYKISMPLVKADTSKHKNVGEAFLQVFALTFRMPTFLNAVK